MMNKKTNRLKGFSNNLVLSLKFGLSGAIIGLILHALWGNLQEVKYTIATGFMIGFFIGLVEPTFSRSFMKNLPYYLVLIFRAVFYFLIILISIYVFLMIYLKSNGLESADLADFQKLEEINRVYFLTNLNLLNHLAIALFGTFFWQLKSFFGKGVLFNYLIGKYHKPTIEERIFMFLDLNEATTIAEKLGPKKYSSLLRSFFNDLDDAFIRTNGQVFQYVGDEVVVIWNRKQGLKNSACIKAFDIALDNLEKNKDEYLRAYDIFPKFKAALHIGEVSITEIGVSKKEIAYHGDAINTTARICGSAHGLGRNLLISKDLYENLPKTKEFIYKELGDHSFKGKHEKIGLYCLEYPEG